ncbi:YnfU family zinc-binding protein [[Pantoea] beijingensis]
MLNLDSLRFFRTRTKSIKCPSCALTDKQLSSKISKDHTMICSHCGAYFTASQSKTAKSTS